MFDIKEYLGDASSPQNGENGFGLFVEENNEEDEISQDIDNLLKNRFDSLYIRDRFKQGDRGIDVIYPRLPYNGKRSLFRGSDHLRFLLSLYPMKSDFDNIDKIVLRPRYIEAGDIELMALYFRRAKILVLYLYTPHFYHAEDSKFISYSEFSSFNLPRILEQERERTGVVGLGSSSFKVPSLWYILSVISHSRDNLIDKFFIKKDPASTGKISSLLNEISFYYSRHGY